MSKRKDGGAAFPEPLNPTGSNGMSLRDYFAAMALQGYITGWPGSDSKIEHFPTIAKMSYKAADAMLAERAKLERV